MSTNWYQLQENGKDRVKEFQAERAQDRLARHAKQAQREHERLARPDFNLMNVLRSLGRKPAMRRAVKRA